MTFNIKTVEGARTRLRLELVHAEPDAPEPECRLFVLVAGVRREFTPADATGKLFILPPLEVGHYGYELVVAQHVVLHGLLMARPSSLPLAAAVVDGVLTVDVPLVVLTLSRGPQGEQGIQGVQGFSAYEVAAQHGYQGTEAEWVAELSGAQAAANVAKSQAEAAAASATAAEDSSTAAGKAQTAAESAAGAAAIAQSAAESAAGEAGTSATAAATQAEGAAASATAAGESATQAATQAGNAAASATAAGKSATQAATQAGNAAASATAAGESAAAAATQAGNAAASATAAATSATAAGDALSAAEGSARLAAQSAETSADAADNVKHDLLPVSMSWLRAHLSQELGEENFALSLSDDELGLTVEFSPDAARSQCDGLLEVCQRIIPQRVKLDAFWFGEIPFDYTPLEYLESSGTQLIQTGLEMTDDTRIKASAVATAMGQDNSLFGLSDMKNHYLLRVRQQNASTFTIQIGTTDNVEYIAYERYFYVDFGESVDVETVGIQKATVNGVTKNGNYTRPWQSSVPMPIPVFAMAYTYGSVVQHNANGSYKLYSFTIWRGEEKQRDFVPVLDSEGNPSLYDRVSKTCFFNSGSGTFGYRIKATGEEFAPMSLRDPYYTAPSGVWARAAGENALEIIADTEAVSGEDWLHFANTSEAYEYFGITQEEIL